jgi:hypothetical protein
MFFFVDNEPVGSRDEAPAGMIYDVDLFKRRKNTDKQRIYGKRKKKERCVAN